MGKWIGRALIVIAIGAVVWVAIFLVHVYKEDQERHAEWVRQCQAAYGHVEYIGKGYYLCVSEDGRLLGSPPGPHLGW